VQKSALFRDGYIASESGHSRGSTVDLTIIAMGDAPPSAVELHSPFGSCEDAKENRFPDASIDMGTGYDCFSVRSHTLHPSVSAQQRVNRLLLKSMMEMHGFRNLPQEWWHYTLLDEPYPDRYFAFPVGALPADGG
jgi:D-alanyl-D-alanine dipeptidase